MDSQDILETLNFISTSISNLRSCHTLDDINSLFRCIQIDLQSIGPYISQQLFDLLDTELRQVHWDQLLKIKGYQA